jgi:hypothetical protein
MRLRWDIQLHGDALRKERESGTLHHYCGSVIFWESICNKPLLGSKP